MSLFLAQFVQSIVFCLVALLAIWVAKGIADKRTTAFDDDYEIEEESNKAVGFRRVGLYLGIAIALAGALSGASKIFTIDLICLLIDSVLVIACLFIGREINDRIMLKDINNDDHCKNGNVAVGLAECGNYLATGMILNGAFTGEGGSFLQGIGSAILFFIFGQIILCLCGACYERITPFNVHKEIKDGNSAAGLGLGGMLFALGIILRASIAGPFQGWLIDIKGFFLSAAIGIVLLLIFRKLIDILLLPDTTLEIEVERDRNVAALALTQGGIIAMALIIASVV